jgi:hypothetical protein
MPTSAAAEVARLIRARLDETKDIFDPPCSVWVEVADEGCHWLFADVGGEYHRYVTIETDGTHPVVRAYCGGGKRIAVDLPQMSDHHERSAILAALVAYGALPDEEGMNH